MLSSGPRTIICEAFKMEKLVVIAFGSVCSEGFTGHASCPPPPPPPHVPFLWTCLLESNQNYQQRDLLETFPPVYVCGDWFKEYILVKQYPERIQPAWEKFFRCPPGIGDFLFKMRYLCLSSVFPLGWEENVLLRNPFYFKRPVAEVGKAAQFSKITTLFRVAVV